MTSIQSKLGLWDGVYESATVRKMYGNDTTAKLAGAWLNQPNILTIEDWGCGFGGFKNYINEHQTYIGVDGSKSIFASKIQDLTTYSSNADAIHMRHVLEHNEDWEKILHNFLKSFSKRAVLTLFTPFSEKTKILKSYENWNGTGKSMLDISFSLDDLMKIINEYPDISVKTQFNIATQPQYNNEHIFYLEKI